MFQLHPFPAAIQYVPPVRLWYLCLSAQVRLHCECCLPFSAPFLALPWALGLAASHFIVSSLPQNMFTFTLERGEFEDGKGKCPYDPAKGHTGLLVGEWLPLL